MGDQVETFSPFTLYGLLIIIGGLIAFRAGSLLKRAPAGADGEKVEPKIIPRLGPGGTEIFAEPVRAVPLIMPKTPQQHRNIYLSKLGIVQ